MTTDERTLDELLALDTYQGMTDAEIQKLIDHKVYVAVNALEVASLESTISSHLSDYKATAEANRAESVAVFKRALANSIIPDDAVILETVEVEGVTVNVEQEQTL